MGLCTGTCRRTDTPRACTSLQDFLNLVKPQTGKKLTAAQAQQDEANGIRALLDC